MRFAVHWPGSPDASPRSHGMPCRDVLGRVHVCVIRVPAGATTKDRLALTVFRVAVPAGVAGLRRETRVDLLYSTGRLVLQPLHEETPPSGQDRSVQRSLLSHITARHLDCALGRTDHVADLQVLYPDDIEVARQISRGLLDPVLASILLTCSKPADCGPGALPSIRSPLRTREPSMESRQTLLLDMPMARKGPQLASRESDGYDDAAVHADNLTRVRSGDRFRGRRKRNMPSAGSVPSNPEGLHTVWYRTRPAEPYPADLRDPHHADIAGNAPGIPVGSPPANYTKTFMPSRFAPSWMPVCAVEEVGLCLSEVFQRLLLNRHRPGSQPFEQLTGFGQLTALLSEPGHILPSRPPVLVLLDCEVPHEARMPAMSQQLPLLFGSGLESITGHANTLSKATDNLGISDGPPMDRRARFREGGGPGFPLNPDPYEDVRAASAPGGAA